MQEVLFYCQDHGAGVALHGMWLELDAEEGRNTRDALPAPKV
jgi:hypothetical protein